MFLRYTFMTLFGILCFISSGQNNFYTSKTVEIDGIKYKGGSITIEGDKDLISESVDIIIENNGKTNRSGGYKLTYFEKEGYKYTGHIIVSSINKIASEKYEVFVSFQESMDDKILEQLLYSILNQFEALKFEKRIKDAEDASEFVSKKYSKALNKIETLEEKKETNQKEIEELQAMIDRLKTENVEIDSLLQLKHQESDSLYHETETMKKAIELIKEEYLGKQ
ncbi:hypothetical protein [Marinigracilibium pacificum]|uniref:Uncharacterized protein n=1 Tax=Marinigracilibium pacificum TaxID=2729599 RepID=A0A848IYQ6_9BACT|nr:hypothetical protein [Marinigracilibium pacificum]NMM47129.1 hypothetical protein [Marinigracilibium pacificum]